MRTADEANALRWKPGHENFYEIYYLTLNNPATRTGCWIRYTLHIPAGNPGGGYLETWFSFFDGREPEKNFGLFRKFPWSSLKTRDQPFSLAIADNLLTSQEATGALTGAGHAVRWDLEIHSSTRPFLHFPDALYSGGQVDSAMCSPHLQGRFSGRLEVDGRSIEMDRDPGEQSHTWGRAHPPHWLWAHCNHFDGAPESAMELVCIPKQRDAASPERAHVFCILHEGKEIRLTSMLDGSRSGSESAPGTWNLKAEGPTARIRLRLRSRLQDLIEAPYVDPNGERCYCVHTDLASSELEAWFRKDENDPWQVLPPLRSTGTTHAEWGDYHRHAEVPRSVIPIE